MTDGPDILDWQLLGFLQKIAQERDHPPSSDEACRTLRTSQERLETSLDVLLRLGYITPNPDSPSGYEVVPTQPPIHDLTPQQLPIVDVIARLRELHGHPPHDQGGWVQSPAFPSHHPRVYQAARVRGLAPHEPRQKAHHRAAQTVATGRGQRPAAAGPRPRRFPLRVHRSPWAGRGWPRRRRRAARRRGLWLPRELVGGDPSSLFSLRITGDSMMGAGVCDRDQVVVRSEV
jgi:hypothetical protein